MRKFLVMAVAATAGLLVSAPAMVPATAAVAATHDVLTISRVGGTNVKVGATLKASLKSGTKATFLIPGNDFVRCSSVTFTAKVTNNPRKKKNATADEKLTAQPYKSCTTNIPTATGRPKVVVTHLPYKTTLSNSRGDPVTVTGTTATITVPTSIGSLICKYGAKNKKTKGSASNSKQTISFSNQPFTLTSGPSGCPKSGKFTATFGPVKDTSVHGSPHVFIN
jgi:hypothetical protein